VSFASQADLADKTITFAELAERVYAYTAEGDPNSGVIVGDQGVMVVDATATPVMAQALLEQIRKVTDKPVTHVLLTHYHAVRVMGASAFQAREILASAATRELIEERGQEDFESEVHRPFVIDTRPIEQPRRIAVYVQLEDGLLRVLAPRLLVGRALDGLLLGDGVPDAHPRVERAVGVLKHHLHRGPHVAELFALELRDVDVIEVDLPGCRLDEPEQGASGGGLA